METEKTLFLLFSSSWAYKIGNTEFKGFVKRGMNQIT